MNKPVQVLSALGFMVCCLCSCGGKEPVVTPTPNDTDKTIALKIENGTSLSYKVSPTESVNYSLDITFRELAPKLSYDFVMTNMDYTKGIIEMEEPAREKSHILSSDFLNGKSILTDRTNMVLSLAVYRDLLEAGKTVLHWGDEDMEFQMLNNEEYTFEKGNGKVTETVMYCTNAGKTKKMWVWKNPELPLIMKMAGGPSLELTYWYLPGERP